MPWDWTYVGELLFVGIVLAPLYGWVFRIAAVRFARAVNGSKGKNQGLVGMILERAAPRLIDRLLDRFIPEKPKQE